MLEGVSKVTLRLMAATLFLILVNTIGSAYQYMIPINLFNIALIAGFGLPGVIAAIVIQQML